MRSHEYPLASSFDEFVEHHGNVGKHKAANVEAEEFGGMAGRQLETDVCQ